MTDASTDLIETIDESFKELLKQAQAKDSLPEFTKALEAAVKWAEVRKKFTPAPPSRAGEASGEFARIRGTFRNGGKAEGRRGRAEAEETDGTA